VQEEAHTTLTILLFAQSSIAQVQTNTPASNLPATRLKVTSNLVVVRVVVRDGTGKPVKGLQKEDFRLFNSGKEQPIAQFEVESAVVSHLRLRQQLVRHHKRVTRFPPHCPDGRRYKWSFLATYSNYHLMTVTSTMLPATSSSQH
jgi:hypothetical protein